ncbi:MAG TPA: DnaJ family domain-containing protein [Syntrophomonadaceae bacterium]|nr:DnaJ family domain-containing protein [Syntrophomonadaceae bacterium]
MNKQRYEKEQMQKLTDKVSEIAWKEDWPAEVQRALHLVRQHDLVGALMKKAVEQGEFDNLEGAGKPLDLGENPFAPDEMHMAYKILKDNGYAPHWIELSKEIDVIREKLNKEVEHFKKYTRMVFSERRSSGAIRRYEQIKTTFYTQSREHLEEISKKILDYNLNCPVSRLGRANFDIDDEMSCITKDIEKFTEDIKGQSQSSSL